MDNKEKTISWKELAKQINNLPEEIKNEKAVYYDIGPDLFLNVASFETHTRGTYQTHFPHIRVNRL